MQMIQRLRIFLAGVCCLVVWGGEVLAASVTLTNSDAANTTSFNTGLNWSNGSAPSSGNDYIVTNRILRTVTTPNATTFAGNSLTIGSGGNFFFKTTGIVTIASLVLSNGTLFQAEAFNQGTNAQLSGGINIINTSTISAQSAASNRAFIINSVLTNSGNLWIRDLNRVTFTNNSPLYSGQVTVTNAWVRLLKGNSLGTTPNIVLLGATNEFLAASGTTLELTNGVHVTGGTLTLTAAGFGRSTLYSGGGSNSWSGTIIANGSGGTRALTAAAGTLTISGAITNTDGNTSAIMLRGINGTGNLNATVNLKGGLDKTDPGTWTIFSSNNVWSATSIFAGTLQMGAHHALATNSLLRLGQVGSTGTLQLNGFNQQVAGFNPATGGDGVITNSGALATFTVANNSTAYYTNGVIAGAINLVKTGSGLLVTDGNHTHTGGTVINAGTLQLGADSSGGANGSLLGGGNVTNNANLVFNRSNLTVPGYSIHGTGTVIKDGVGTLQVNSANTYTGGTVINTGTLLLGNNERLANTGAVTINGGAFNLGGFTETVGAVTLNSGTITNGTLSGASFTKATGGTGSLTAGTTYQGNVVVNGGRLAVNGTVVGSLTVNSGSLSGNGTVAGLTTIASGGWLAPGNSVGTNTTGALTMSAGSFYEWEFNGGANDLTIVTNFNGLTINGGAFSLFQENTVTTFDAPGLYRLIQYTGTIAGAGISMLSVSNQTINRSYTFGTTPDYVVLNIAGVSGWDGGDSANSFWQSSTNWGGNVAPSANSNLEFDGNTRIINTNNFVANTQFAGFTFNSTAAAFELYGAAVNLTAGIINNSTVSQTIHLPLVLDTLTPNFNAAAGNIIVNGNISETNGPVGLIKTGARMLVLNGNNSYTGATTVNGGTLLINGNLTSGGAAVTVNSSGAFGGTGTVNRVVNIASGGTLTPGAFGAISAGIFTVQTLTLANNFTYQWDLGMTRTDRVDVANLDFTGSTWTLRLGLETPFTGSGINQSNNVYQLMTWDSATAGVLNLTNNYNLVGNGKWNFDNAQVYIQGDALYLTGVYVIPEPSVLLLVGGGLLTIYFARRRQRRGVRS